MRTRNESSTRNPARIHARAAHADDATVADDLAEHHLEVVEPRRDLLFVVGGRDGVTDQEDPYLVALLSRQGAGEAGAVIGALAAIRCIVER